jgi:hypothetical protein
MDYNNEKKQEILDNLNWRIVVSRSNKNDPWIYLGRVERTHDHRLIMRNIFNLQYYKEIGLIGNAESGPEKVDIKGSGLLKREVSELMVLDCIQISHKWWDFLLPIMKREKLL